MKTSNISSTFFSLMSFFAMYCCCNYEKFTQFGNNYDFCLHNDLASKALKHTSTNLLSWQQLQQHRGNRSPCRLSRSPSSHSGCRSPGRWRTSAGLAADRLPWLPGGDAGEGYSHLQGGEVTGCEVGKKTVWLQRVAGVVKAEKRGELIWGGRWSSQNQPAGGRRHHKVAVAAFCLEETERTHTEAAAGAAAAAFCAEATCVCA